MNHFGLGRGDHDHVVVGPGGVILVETKWGGTPWDVDTGDISLRLPLEQTARNAKQLALWPRRGQARPPAGAARARGVGPAAGKLRELPIRRHTSGVVVMPGDRLQEWMLRQPLYRFTPANVEAVFDEIDRHLVRRDERERASRPMPASLLPRWCQASSPDSASGLAAFPRHELAAPAR